MKINGKDIKGPQMEVVVIPRGDEEIVIKAQAIMDYSDHEKINPQPLPPSKLLPGGETQQLVEDPGYLKKLSDWAQQKTDWMIIKSLSATEGLTWDTVKADDPTTWSNYRKELDATFTPAELGKILEVVMSACGLNQSKIEEATKRFLAGQAGKQ
jgi:hypothetical protein